MMIGAREIGSGKECWTIAELGINHNGDVGRAVEMVHAAAESGAGAVKCQAFSPACFVSKHATYKGESQEALFSRYVLNPDDFYQIAIACKASGVTFLGTPDCEEHARLLLNLGAPALKVGSDDLTNLPLIRSFAGMGVPLILSTGMADLGEVEDAVDAAHPNEDVILCHCVSLYPTPLDRANLRRVEFLRNFYRRDTAVAGIGYSDHTDGIEAAMEAVSHGAVLVEKHFTLSRDLPGPDHAFSADPEQFSAMVAGIRRAEARRGGRTIDELRFTSDEEKAMRLVARRSVRSRFDCKEGTLLTMGHLVFQRPGDGLSPADVDKVLGKSLRVNKSSGDIILAEDVR